MELIAPILASAGFVIIVQLLINIAEHSSTFRQWKSQRKAAVEDELHGELKRQNDRLEKENEILRSRVEQWQEKYYRLLVEHQSHTGEDKATTDP
jgi:FtsZ-binding cell division protein ZapB